jgi:hypothetical protein
MGNSFPHGSVNGLFSHPSGEAGAGTLSCTPYPPPDGSPIYRVYKLNKTLELFPYPHPPSPSLLSSTLVSPYLTPIVARLRRRLYPLPPLGHRPTAGGVRRRRSRRHPRIEESLAPVAATPPLIPSRSAPPPSTILRPPKAAAAGGVRA